MKKVFICLILFSLGACDNENDRTSFSADTDTINYRDEMRNLVIGISQKGNSYKPGFVVIPQNGIELVSSDGEIDGTPSDQYLNAISGNGQEDFLYGYSSDNAITPADVTSYLKGFLDISKNAGKTILVTDYCSTSVNVSNSYSTNATFGYVSFAASQRSLNVIPAEVPYNVNSRDVAVLSEAKNFLYLINPENFASKADFIAAVASTDYDAVIMDLFLNDNAFTATEIAQLKTKANGGKRLVLCYMSIGEAEDYRYYWNTTWNNNKPEWVETENPDWPGNYKVRYWNAEWQYIIYKGPDSYLDRIVNAGFDGVYLDIIDAFEYFER